MQRVENDIVSRRTMLKTVGAVGIASVVGFSGSVAAETGTEAKGHDFGNANGIGAFLNEDAAYKDSPVWSSGVVDMTGRENVEVVVGAMTSVDVPDLPWEEGPFAFAPRAVKVSPGTTVTWTWASYPDPVPAIPHDIVSLKDGVFNSGMRFPGADFTHTFGEAGNYLYYCTPHGAPFPVHPHGAPEDVRIYNEFGMRGAVIVADD